MRCELALGSAQHLLYHCHTVMDSHLSKSICLNSGSILILYVMVWTFQVHLMGSYCNIREVGVSLARIYKGEGNEAFLLI